MPTQDLQHQVVVRAMRKDGWQIEKEQVYIRFGTRRLWVDLRASKSDSTIVLVEIKGFDANASAVEALAQAVGQYTIYRAALRFREMTNIPLYLAVPQHIYLTIFNEPIGDWTRREAAINLLIYDVEREEIVEWIPSSR